MFFSFVFLMLRSKGFTGFFGMQMYQQLVPANHFLRNVDDIVDWLPVIRKITPCYKGGFNLGASALNPVTLFKMMFLGYLYDLSERDLERMCNESIPFKYFIEIGIDEKAPDHSTLSLFRMRIIKHYGDESVFEDIFVELLAQIMDAGITLGSVQSIDSKHLNARVSRHRKAKKGKMTGQKEEEINARRKAEGKKEKDFRTQKEIDPHAGSGCKGTQKKKDKNGNIFELPKWFFGYKAHCSVESDHDIFTSAILTPGNEDDGSYFEPLLMKDIGVRRTIPDGYTADKGYDYGDNHFLLNRLDIHDGIYLKDTRLKDDKTHAIWHTIQNSEENRRTRKHRFKVERGFGDVHNNHRMKDCVSFGRVRAAIQMFMAIMAHNIKKAVKVLHGISHKTPPPTRLVPAA
jgi:IS5 family transposase